jgi:hypothetical protein
MGNLLSKSSSPAMTTASPTSPKVTSAEPPQDPSKSSTISPAVPSPDPEDVIKNDETAAPKPPTSEQVGSLTEKLAATLPFDPAEIKKKYLEERDKRIREDGNAQYKEFKGQFAHYLIDPYTPRVERAPLDIETDFLVLGGGFGGLSLAAELVKAGIKDFKVIDKAGDFGGTWYWNRYPGAACDIGRVLVFQTDVKLTRTRKLYLYANVGGNWLHPHRKICKSTRAIGPVKKNWRTFWSIRKGDFPHGSLKNGLGRQEFTMDCQNRQRRYHSHEIYSICFGTVKYAKVARR